MYNVMYGYQVCRQRSVFRSQSGQKYVGGRSSITDPAEGAYSALPDPLAGGSPLSMTILFEEGDQIRRCDTHGGEACFRW